MDVPCVYKNVNGSWVIFLILYVDDILLMKNDISLLYLVKIWLFNNFSMKNIRETTYILKIKIYKDISKRLFGLSQSTYIDKMLKWFSMEKSKK
jgi:hypothetical protein